MVGMTRGWRSVLLAALLGGCGSYGSSGPQGPNGGGSGGGGGDGAVGGGGQTQARTVTVGNDFFRSDRNGTANPAVDTVVVGGTVRFTWMNTGATPHSVESEDQPHFESSDVLSGSGSRYEATFPVTGSYVYDCAVHGGAMGGVVVVVER